MRLGRTNKGMVRVRPSRFYSFLDGNRRETAVGVVLFAFIGLGFAVVTVFVFATPATDSAGRIQARPNPWLLIPCLFFELGWFLVAYVIWTEIPLRVIVTTLDQVRALCADRSFVLILWSFREYQDLLGTATVYEGVNMVPRNAPQSLDCYIADVASEFELRSIRLWHKDASPLVDVSSKSIHVICPDVIWRNVVLVALHAAAAIVLIPGRGEGLVWEREVVATSSELGAKTLNLSGLEMAELKPTITKHFERLTIKVRVTSRVRTTL